MVTPQDVREQEERTERARTTPWYITPMKPSNPAVIGLWRVRDRTNGHKPHAVTRRKCGNGEVVWDCDCPDQEFNPRFRCKHIEAVRLFLTEEITADIEPVFRQGQSPDQTLSQSL